MNKITCVGDFQELHQIKFGFEFKEQLSRWKEEIRETKKKLEESEKERQRTDQFIRVEQPFTVAENEDESGLKRIRYGVQELIGKFAHGLAGGQEEVRPKKMFKLVKKMGNLLDGILKKLEFKVPNVIKNIIVANSLNILLLRGVIAFTDGSQESIEYANNEELDSKILQCIQEDNRYVLLGTEVQV